MRGAVSKSQAAVRVFSRCRRLSARRQAPAGLPMFLLAWAAHCRGFQLTRNCRFKCLSCSVSAERKSFFSKRRGSYAMRSFCF
jgi:hypothetical protein